MGLTLASWLAALQALLPPGRAFTREPGAVLTRVLEAIAAQLLAAQLRLEALLIEWDPRRATTMLPDWERLLGLPDKCTPAGSLSILERQRIAYQRLVEQGGASRAYFIGLAEQLGEPDCTITEFRRFTCGSDCNDAVYSEADLFTWRVNIPHPAQDARFMTCNDDCNDPLQQYKPSVIECPIEERRPAHTNVIFGYDDTDPDARLWASAVTANGGTYTEATLAAVSIFCASAKLAGYWDKLNRINLFCGNELAAALVPLKVGGGFPLDANVNFVGVDYALATGLTGDFANKYLNTGLVPSASLTLNDTHLAVYNRAASSVWGGAHIGANKTAAAIYFEMLAPFTDNQFYSRAYTAAVPGGAINTGVAAPYGLMVGSRTAANSHAIYKNGIQLASNAGAGGALPEYPIFVFARNSTGLADTHTGHPLGGYSIGAGLTAGEVAAYTTHMEAFQDALGRGVQP